VVIASAVTWHAMAVFWALRFYCVLGFGFLTFDSEESADSVVKEHFVHVNGKQVGRHASPSVTIQTFISLYFVICTHTNRVLKCTVIKTFHFLSALVWWQSVALITRSFNSVHCKQPCCN